VLSFPPPSKREESHARQNGESGRDHRRERPRDRGTILQVGSALAYRSAHANRVEICVGYPTLGAVLAEKFVPRLPDRYLARTGIAGQQTDEPIPADRPNKLWPPVPGPFAAHGSFDPGAWKVSPEFWAAKHRSLLWAGAALGVGLYGLKRRNLNRRRG
jgi:hypothetical protein